MKGNWGENSDFIVFDPSGVYTLYVAIAVGIFTLLHSFYLHGKKFKVVRIASDASSVALICEAFCFLSCVWGSCNRVDRGLVYLAIGNAFFGLICQWSDNYMTFARYDVVCGGTSFVHKWSAAAWVMVCLTLSWWPFMNIFPFFSNMNSGKWILVQYIVSSWFDFIAYLLYDIFYVVLLVRTIIENERKSSVNTNTSTKLRMLASKAILHSILSIVGILVYSFNQPYGIIEQNILITVGIHFFLNWSNSHTFLYNLVVLASSYINSNSNGRVYLHPDVNTSADGKSSDKVGGSLNNANTADQVAEQIDEEGGHRPGGMENEDNKVQYLVDQ